MALVIMMVAMFPIAQNINRRCVRNRFKRYEYACFKLHSESISDAVMMSMAMSPFIQNVDASHR